LLIFVVLLGAAAAEGWVRSRRARETPEPLTPAQSIALSSARWVMLAVTIAIPVTERQQAAWIYMNWQEKGRISSRIEAAATAKGLTLSPEGIVRELTLARWRSTGYWRGVRSGALLAGLLALVAGYFLRGSTAPFRDAALAGLVVSIVSAAGLACLQRPWSDSRKAQETRAIHRHTWINDLPLNGQALEGRLGLRELREHSSATGFLVAGLGIGLLIPASAWLQTRGIARNAALDAKPAFLSLRRWAILCLIVTSLWWSLLQVPGVSGVQQGIPANDMARRLLNTLRMAQENYCFRDADANGIQDWWVGDVSGLHRRIIQGKPLNLIDARDAELDGAPLRTDSGTLFQAPLNAPSKPGYRFAIIPKGADGSLYAEDLDGDGHAFESRKGYAYSAYWEGEAARVADTLIMDQTGKVWRKSTGNLRVLQWPKDPSAEGWVRWVDGSHRPPYLELLRQEHE
jgi:hypothetical protein